MVNGTSLHVNSKFLSKFSRQWRIQDFPKEGAPTPQGGRQHTILPKFPKNCMKSKEFGPPGVGARPLRPPLDPPLPEHPSLEFQIRVPPPPTK